MADKELSPTEIASALFPNPWSRPSPVFSTRLPHGVEQRTQAVPEGATVIASADDAALAAVVGAVSAAKQSQAAAAKKAEAERKAAEEADRKRAEEAAKPTREQMRDAEIRSVEASMARTSAAIDRLARKQYLSALADEEEALASDRRRRGKRQLSPGELKSRAQERLAARGVHYPSPTKRTTP